MRIDMCHLIEDDVKGLTDLEDVAEVRYPTGCVDLTKREILCKLSEIEFRMNGTWTEEFLEEFENDWRYRKAPELARILVDKLTEIYEWSEPAYEKLLG
jgi:hypothetical protein